MTAKYIVAVLAVVAVAFLLVNYTIVPRTPISERTAALPASEQERLEASVRDIDAQLALLQAQLAELARKLELLAADGLADQRPAPSHVDVSQRLDALEQSITDISRRSDVVDKSERARVREEMAERYRNPQPIQQALYTENTAALDIFERDSGVPLDTHAEQAIAEVFHASDYVNMQQIYCKKSLCKVTYSRTDSDPQGAVSADERDFALLDQLGDELGWDDLDVRYARDEQGNDVMYVQRN